MRCLCLPSKQHQDAEKPVGVVEAEPSDQGLQAASSGTKWTAVKRWMRSERAQSYATPLPGPSAVIADGSPI